MYDGDSEENASHQGTDFVHSYESLGEVAQPQLMSDPSPSQRLQALGIPKACLDPVPCEDLSTIIAFSENHPNISIATWFSGIFTPEELANAAIAMRKAFTCGGKIDGVT